MTLALWPGYSPDGLILDFVGFGSWHLFTPHVVKVAWLSLHSLFPAVYLIVALGALRMRRLQDYRMAVASAVLAMATPPLLPFGLPLGLGALAVLSRKETRQQFRTVARIDDRARGVGGPGVSRLAVAAMALALIPVVASLAPRPLAWLIWLRRWPSLGTVLLGWIALEDIRRNNGKLRGAGAAAFGLLFFPCSWALRQVANAGAEPDAKTYFETLAFELIVDLLTVLVCGGIALWVHRNEVQSRERSLGGASDWWVCSRPAAWVIRTLVCAAFAVSLTNVRWLRTVGDPEFGALVSHIAGHAQRAAPDEASRVVVRLPWGEAEFLSVSENSPKSSLCWLPDGTQICGKAERALQAPGRTRQVRSLVLAMRVTGPPGDMGRVPCQLYIDGKAAKSSFWGRSGINEYASFPAAADARLLDVHLGEAASEWQDTYAGWEWNGKMSQRPERFVSLAGQQTMVRAFGLSGDHADGASAQWNARSLPAGWVGRLVAVDDAGISHEPSASMPSLQEPVGTGMWVGDRVVFNGLPASRIKELRFQVHQCRWVEIRNIALQPGLHTQVSVVDAGGHKYRRNRRAHCQGSGAWDCS